MTDYRLCGWHLRSDLALPELPRLPGADPKNGQGLIPDIVIRLGDVPEKLDNLVGTMPFVQVAQDGTCRLELPGVARFLVSEGRDIIVGMAGTGMPLSPDDAAAVRSLLLGSVLGILVHQRGLFPLHASCVQIGDGAYAIAGASGAGKSTTAAALTRRGALVLSNAFCVIDLTKPDRPVVRPAAPALTLWHDVTEALNITAASQAVGRPGQVKYQHIFSKPDQGDGHPVPLRGLLFPNQALPKQPDRMVRLTAKQCASLLFNMVYRFKIGRLLNRQLALLQGAAMLAETVPAFQIDRQLDLSGLDALAALIYAELT